MGCNGSRLKDPESIPAKFRPILRRRIEEVKRKRRLVTTKDESTKEELLVNVNDVNEGLERLDEKNEKMVQSGLGNKKKKSDDQEGHEEINERSIIYPGSPSFRIYFVDNGNHSDNEDDLEFAAKGEGVKEKIEISDLDALPEKELGTKTVVKKVKKRRSLKGVIPKGGPAAVKNLLNVKACYNPSCGGRPVNANPISEKAQP